MRGGGSTRDPSKTWVKRGENADWEEVIIDGTSIVGSGGQQPTTQIPNISDVTSIEIGNTITSIGNEAFCDCSGLTSVTIPDGVTSIGVGAFAACTSLTSITIPDSVKSIEDYAFYDCTSLASVTIGDSVEYIGEMAFYNAPFDNNLPDGLVILGKVAYMYKGTCPAEVTIPDSVTSISYGAFASCSSLATIDIPSSATSIGEKAFYSCTSLASIDIPDSVTSIGSMAFENCTSLVSVAFVGKTKAEVQSIDNCYQSIENCYWGLKSGCVIICTDGEITVETIENVI